MVNIGVSNIIWAKLFVFPNKKPKCTQLWTYIFNFDSSKLNVLDEQNKLIFKLIWNPVNILIFVLYVIFLIKDKWLNSLKVDNFKTQA